MVTDERSSSEEEILQGGVHQIRKVGDAVIRPVGPHSPSVHRVLRHLAARGVNIGPEPIAINQADRTETLSFVPGETTGHPLAPSFTTDKAVSSAAQLLRRLHDATEDFVVTEDDVWDLPPKTPAEVICHGDFAPYNCAVIDGLVTGVFDFDTAHPGPRLWDLGYAAYRWVPLTSPDNPEFSSSPVEQARRLTLFCQAYGWHGSEAAVVEAAADRLVALVEMILERAEGGNAAFQRHIEEGHHLLYLADIAHLRSYGD